MTDTDVIPKQVSLESDSGGFMEAIKVSIDDESKKLIRIEPSISVPPATEAALSANEISQDTDVSSNTIEPFSGESSSTLVASQTVGDVSEDEQQPVEVDPTIPLLPERYEDDSSINVIDNQTAEAPQSPSIFHCMCCYITTNNIHGDKQKITYYIHYTRKIRNSKYLLLVLAALLTIPISSIYYGFTYKDGCPKAKFLPVVLIIMGVLGVILIAVRLVTVSIRRRFREVKALSKAVSISLTYLLIVFLTMEMITIYTQKPVFDNPKDISFCEKAFYDYAFYMNFVVLGIGILALLLHIPKQPHSEERVVAWEHLDATAV